jgi:hypothetical protein
VWWKNFSSFGFAKGRLFVGAKPNVLKCSVGFCLFSARLKFELSVGLGCT